MEENEQIYVLIVEDEDSIRLTLRDYLKNKGEVDKINMRSSQDRIRKIVGEIL